MGIEGGAKLPAQIGKDQKRASSKKMKREVNRARARTQRRKTSVAHWPIVGSENAAFRAGKKKVVCEMTILACRECCCRRHRRRRRRSSSSKAKSATAPNLAVGLDRARSTAALPPSSATAASKQGTTSTTTTTTTKTERTLPLSCFYARCPLQCFAAPRPRKAAKKRFGSRSSAQQ